MHSLQNSLQILLRLSDEEENPVYLDNAQIVEMLSYLILVIWYQLSRPLSGLVSIDVVSGKRILLEHLCNNSVGANTMFLIIDTLYQ